MLLVQGLDAGLGKLITYTAMMEAQVAIWIVAEARPEQ